MRREYVVRGQRVEVEELEGVVAVMPRVRGASREDISRTFGNIAQLPSGMSEEADWVALGKAGWVFVRPTAAVTRAIESRSSVEGAEAVQRVFRHPSGRTFLGTDRLSVRLRADMTEQQVNRKSVGSQEGPPTWMTEHALNCLGTLY